MIGEGKRVYEPDPLLVLYLRCKNLRCLPNQGGYFDQDPELMYYFSEISSSIDEASNKKSQVSDSSNRKPARQIKGRIKK